MVRVTYFQAGENVVTAFSNFLNRVGSRTKVTSASEDMALLLKEKLLAVLCNLLSPCGAMACRKGPLDAQIVFLSFLQECDFTNVEFSRGTDIIMKIGEIFYLDCVFVVRTRSICVYFFRRHSLDLRTVDELY